MNFQHLKTEKCPICGAEARLEGVEVEWGKNPKVMVHVNGQRCEWRDFICGLRVQWVPNFEREEIDHGHECRNSPEVKAKERKRDSAAKKLQALIDTLDVDDYYKRDVNFPGRRRE